MFIRSNCNHKQHSLKNDFIWKESVSIIQHFIQKRNKIIALLHRRNYVLESDNTEK